MLTLKLTKCVVLKFAKLKTFVSALSVDLLVKVVLCVINSLHDVLLLFDSSVDLAIELVLQA